MINKYPATSRYSTNHGWLQSNFSFSFAEYFDRDNMNFGPLRVFNDDFVQPQTGFGSHPHREMEIVSIILKGSLQHQDSMGNKEIIRVGEIQRMTAGTGIIHSEMNPSDTEEVNFLQLWFEPDQTKLTPTYEQTTYDLQAHPNQLVPIVSNKTYDGFGTALIHQDMTLYLSNLEQGQNISFEQEEGRRIYVFVIEGELTLNGETLLEKRDAARITGVQNLQLSTNKGAQFMLIDLP